MKRILIVEDEQSLASMLADRLQAEGYDTALAHDGPAGLRAAIAGEFDLIVLDVMLPGFDGFELCRRLRDAESQTPVLMLTARGDVADRIAGLRTGADDYLPKPFDAGELLARMEALLRRAAPKSRFNEFADVRVDRGRRTVTRAGSPVELSLKEFEMLCYLLDRAGTPVTREELLQKVWGYGVTPNTRTVDVHMAQLRQKLEANPKEPVHLVTAHGFGYKFAASR
jgi:two-component system alkaline phosphatase synthesis response regulator PhoP